MWYYAVRGDFMYAPPPKKLLIMNILDILKKYTDENHRLSQKEIVEILDKEYNMKTDRKSVKRNLMNLIEFGYDIEYSESIRIIKSKNGQEEESLILTDFYLNRDFTVGELRLLIDSILFSNHIHHSQCKELVEKLEGLSNIYFRSRIKHIATFDNEKADNKQLFYTVDVLDEAIGKGKKVSFHYLEYGTDKKLHLRRPDGSVREYIINPYQMAAKEGKYYLICNYDKYDDISNYRIDRIADIKILDEAVKPFEQLNGANKCRLNLKQYIDEHIYMFSSDTVHAKFRITKPMISDVIDMFGNDVKFTGETDSYVTVTANVNEMAMLQFAKSFAPDVVILEPKQLRDKIKNDLEIALEKYKN